MDIDVTEFLIERKRLDSFVCVVDKKVKNDLMQRGPFQLLKFILGWDLATSVPNVMILLRILLTMGVRVSSCERSFSKLKLIKSYLRSTMTSSRPSSPSTLSIEHEVTDRINFDSVIDEFAERKARKICF